MREYIDIYILYIFIGEDNKKTESFSIEKDIVREAVSVFTGGQSPGMDRNV